MDRIFQSLDGRSQVFHLNFGIRYCAVKFLLRNTPRALLVWQVVRHVIVEPVGIRNNDINKPLQIVEEAGENLPAPRIIGGGPSAQAGLFVMMNMVRFWSVTRSDRKSPYLLEATWNHRVSIGLNASQSARNASRLSYSPEAINSSASPHSSGVGRGTSI